MGRMSKKLRYLKQEFRKGRLKHKDGTKVKRGRSLVRLAKNSR